MKRILATLAAVATIGLIAPAAQAGFLIEPWLGYGISGEVGDPAEDLGGTGLGLRVGWSILGLQFGGSYSMYDLTAEDSASVETEYKVTDMSLFAGYEFPILLRAWVEYSISAEAEQGTNTLDASGGTKLGIGYTGLPFIAINLEMITHKYDKLTTASGAEFDADTKSSLTMLSVSLPLP